MIFLADKNNNCCPIEWKSNHIKRVVRSALGAGSLACTDCIEADIYWSKLVTELLKLPRDLRIVHHTDSRSLIDNLKSTKTVNDRLLRVDLNVMRESVENHPIDFKWINSESNVSDILTKAGVSAEKVLTILKNGHF